MDNPFEIDLEEERLQECAEIVAEENIEVIDEDKLKLETIFYTAAKYIREREDFQEVIEWITFFESEFDCAGVCNISLFAWTNSIEEGRPQQNCYIGISEGLKPHLTGLAISSFASGVLLLLTFIFQYCLWAKYQSDSKSQKNLIHVNSEGL